MKKMWVDSSGRGRRAEDNHWFGSSPTPEGAKCKSDLVYMDSAINSHGAEKAFMTHRVLKRTRSDRPRVVEIGPGGGAAVSYLTDRLVLDPVPEVHLTLIEAPGITSQSLVGAIEEFNRVGECELKHGLAQDIGTLLSEPVDVISASAVLHEIYSYGGAYAALYAMLRTLPTVLAPGGFFAYRDVYSVNCTSLHERILQIYESRSWLTFLRLFTPSYLARGTHPYHHAGDELVARQDSRIVPVADLDPGTSALIAAPAGLCREVQRHYITFRDHLWRSGVLGLRPVLDGDMAADWIDFRSGHKRVHFRFDEAATWLSEPRRAMLEAMSDVYLDHRVIDGDTFDTVTDDALKSFLEAVERDDISCRQVWDAWLHREGRESYVYLTVNQLLEAFAECSAEAGTDTVLVPVGSDDVRRVDRHYYNRYLSRRLADPLTDAKQLVLFQNIPRDDLVVLRQAFDVMAGYCDRSGLARIYSAINRGDS